MDDVNDVGRTSTANCRRSSVTRDDADNDRLPWVINGTGVSMKNTLSEQYDGWMMPNEVL